MDWACQSTGTDGMLEYTNRYQTGNNGRWHIKVTAVAKDLLSNAIANGETKGLDPDNLFILHAQCNRAPAGRRRTYRDTGGPVVNKAQEVVSVAF